MNVGQYTQHWKDYQRASNRRTLQILGVVACLPGIALIGYWLSSRTPWALAMLGALLVAWLTFLVRLAIRSTKVCCPQCGAHYSRGKYVSNCPQCGLRMLQEDPN